MHPLEENLQVLQRKWLREKGRLGFSFSQVPLLLHEVLYDCRKIIYEPQLVSRAQGVHQSYYGKMPSFTVAHFPEAYPTQNSGSMVLTQQKKVL